jgi:hypothetical protein
MTRQADRNAERQDPKGLGPEGMRAAVCEADAPNTSPMDKTVEVSQAARDATERSAHGPYQRSWCYDFDRVPNGLIEVAFDAGLGFCHVEICQRVVTKSKASHDRWLPVEQYEYGFIDQYGKPAYPDRRAYAWREIDVPPRSPVETTPPIASDAEGIARELLIAN